MEAKARIIWVFTVASFFLASNICYGSSLPGTLRAPLLLKKTKQNRECSFRDLGGLRGRKKWQAMEEERRRLIVKFLGTKGTEPIEVIPFDHHNPAKHYGHPELMSDPNDPTECMLLIAENMADYVKNYLIHPGYMLGRRHKETKEFVNLKGLATLDKKAVRESYEAIILHPQLPTDKLYVLKWEGETTPTGDISKGDQYKIGNRPTNQGEELNIAPEEVAQIEQVVGLKFMTYVDSSSPEAYNTIIDEVKKQSISTHKAGLLFFPEDLPAKTAAGKDLDEVFNTDLEKAKWAANNPKLFAKALFEAEVDFDAYKFTFPGDPAVMEPEEYIANLKEMYKYLVDTVGMMLSGGKPETLIERATVASREFNRKGDIAGRGVWQDSFFKIPQDPGDISGVKEKIAKEIKTGSAKRQYDALSKIKPIKPWWEFLGLTKQEILTIQAKPDLDSIQSPDDI